mmetsp:Transcript_57980/g.109214  ORF Transcript_57980/g.109214 Transcript_57980/m.109214 type:complete len:200 (-) Transcript_57980:1157-1756(-)
MFLIGKERALAGLGPDSLCSGLRCGRRKFRIGAIIKHRPHRSFCMLISDVKHRVRLLGVRGAVNEICCDVPDWLRRGACKRLRFSTCVCFHALHCGWCLTCEECARGTCSRLPVIGFRYFGLSSILLQSSGLLLHRRCCQSPLNRVRSDPCVSPGRGLAFWSGFRWQAAIGSRWDMHNDSCDVVQFITLTLPTIGSVLH